MSRYRMWRVPLLAVLLMLVSGMWATAVYGSSPSSPEAGGGNAGGNLEQSADWLMQEQLRMIETGSVEAYWTELMNEYGGYFPGGRMPSFAELVKSGGNGLKLADILKGLLRYILHEVV
jgi:stage III sporulation protein AE